MASWGRVRCVPVQSLSRPCGRAVVWPNESINGDVAAIDEAPELTSSTCTECGSFTATSRYESRSRRVSTATTASPTKIQVML